MEPAISSVDKKISSQIVRARLREGMTIATTAKMLDLREADYLDIERGKTRIGSHLIVQLSIVLKNPIAWFFNQLPEEVSFPIKRYAMS